jgi:phage gp45-like
MTSEQRAHLDGLSRLLQPVIRALRLGVRRAILASLDDSAKIQLAQIAFGAVDDSATEARAKCERFQQYGFTSVPHGPNAAGEAEAIVFFLGGQCDHPIVLAVDDRRYRLKGLEAGEVAIYSDEGDQVVIKRGGNIRVVASTKVEITSPHVTISGDLTVAGDVKSTSGDVVAGSIHLKTHKHSGVSTGVALSGLPV